MSKSFKKVLACLLAVLMVTFSVPFSALAAAGDYAPDITLRFGTMHGGPAKNINSWVDQTLSDAGVTQATKMTGIFDTPVTLTKDGELVLEASKMATTYSASSRKYAQGGTFSAQDYTYQVGDVFTVTVKVNNVNKMAILDEYISYSDNVEPVGIVTYTNDDYDTANVFATQSEFDDFENYVDDYTENDDAAWNGIQAGMPIAAQSIGTLGDQNGNKYLNYSQGAVDDGSTAADGVINARIAPDFPTGTTSAAVASMSGAYCADDGTMGTAKAPVTIDGCYLETFAFKIVGTGAISFEQQDPTNFRKGFFVGDTADGTDPSDYTTYSINTYGIDGAASNEDENIPEAQRNPGSTKMTFMGKNSNVASEEPTHTHDFTGAVPVWTWADDNSSATATITCVDASCDNSEGYQISATDSDIESTVKTAGTCTTAAVNTLTASVTLNGATVSTTKDVEGAIDAENHSYTDVYTGPTCTANGFTTYTCSRCGASYVEYDDPDTTLAHSYTVPVSIAWDSEDAVTATVTLKCATCTDTTTTAATVDSVEKSAATCTDDQVMTYTASYAGIDSISKDVTVANTATDHQWVPESVNWNSLNTETNYVGVNFVCAHDASHTVSAPRQATAVVTQEQTEDLPELTTFTVTIGDFTDSKEVQTKAAAGHTTHTYTVPVSIAWDSEDAVTATVTLKCTKCDATTTTAATVNSVEKSAATCTANQVMTYTASYAGLDSISKDVEVANTATDHNWTATEITWDGADAVTATANFVCENDDTHTKTEAATVDKALKTAATVSAPAVYTYTASYAGFDSITKDVEEGEALGVNITIPKYDIGEIKFDGELVDGTKANTFNVAYGAEYTLEVSDGTDYFSGWEVNKNIISKDASVTSYAYADITVTPVFDVPNTNTITVVFYDMFGNKVKEYKDMEVNEYQTAINADGIPTGQSYPSQKFVGWDIEDDAILALSESKTIWGVYEQVESVKKFNVTVQDATGTDITATALTLPSGIEATAVPYDTKATVYNENAKGWEVDGVTVSTSDTFTFYVGADTTVKMIVDDVEAVPTVTIVGGNRLADPAYRWNIVATRNVPAGYTLVDYGFVYGKNMTQDDLTVENEGNKGTLANAGNVKVTRAGTQNSSSNQFALNYGIKNMDGKVCARAFVTVKKGSTVEVIYSDMAEFNY